ncbi:MAG: carbamoyltransferase HypF [Candidatus Lokiarchaeota archaeon]|nr:carbamoyltransferase HypF [Candidatus Lokiarchaeota archaeon]
MESILVDIEGIVQGVGFRPFLYNLALAHGLKGWVMNRGNAGVRLRLEGEKASIDRFLHEISEKRPSISRVDSMAVEHVAPPEHFTGMVIRPSEDARGPAIVLPADIATCDECIKELTGRGPGGKANKYFMYPFVACANCGPRFTTVSDLPYDRSRTTMADFPLCDKGQVPTCEQEYEDAGNRRFHAQAFACPNCGPNYFLADHGGHVLSRELDAIKQAARKLKEGRIIAMKGIGGVHLVCDSSSDRALVHLRDRKGGRRYKPFAVLVPDVAAARKLVHVSDAEERALSSHRRPILLLKRKPSAVLSVHVAPGLNSVGIMLPYMGAQHMLLQYCRIQGLGPLVCTSGNRSGLPMAITNEDIVGQLGTLADYFLLHDRRIQQRCDDSVGKTIDDALLLVRRSRGFVPEFVPSPVDTGGRAIVAVGPELHSTGAILKGDKLFATQYIGDVVNLETLTYLQDAIEHFRRLLRVSGSDVTAVACDAHPAFHSSTWAKELSENTGASLYPVYHHHAHCAALVLDNKLDPSEPRVYVTCDGVGYGVDGKAWGGEIFAGSLQDLRRAAHLKYVPMPGGDAAVKYPARMLTAFLHGKMARGEIEALFADKIVNEFKGGLEELAVVLGQLDRGQELPLTSSTGRLLDAMSVALGACYEMTYEGEPAIRLEGMVPPGSDVDEVLKKAYQDAFTTKERGNCIELDMSGAFPLLIRQTNRYSGPSDRARHALAFQSALGSCLGNTAVDVAKRDGIKAIGFTGGVAYNEFIFTAIREAAKAAGLGFFHHAHLPPGDGCVAAGQALLAWLAAGERA